jgi:hypothetical protein
VRFLDSTRRLPVWGWLVLAIAAFVLVGIAFMLEVRITVLEPDIGDVSGLVGAIGTTLATFAGLASFAIGIYNQVTEESPKTDGPERRFEFAGENNEFNLYFREKRGDGKSNQRARQTDEKSEETNAGGGDSQESS